MALSVTAHTQATSATSTPGPSAASQKSQVQPQGPVDQLDSSGSSRAARRRDKGKGKAPLSGPCAPQNAPRGVRTSQPQAHTSAPRESRAPQATPAIAAPDALSAVTEIKSENGELTFILTIAATVAGQPDQKYKISVLGGEQADLAGLNRSDLAKHLTQAITLVQGNLETKDFSSITFEGRLGDDALAKAVVHTKTSRTILGGNRDDRVSGTEKVFSDELEELLKRLQRTLAVRTSRVKIDRMPDAPLPAAPPPTPMTQSFAGSDAGDRQAEGSEADELWAKALIGPSRSGRRGNQPRFEELQSDDETDLFYDAPEFAETVAADDEDKKA